MKLQILILSQPSRTGFLGQLKELLRRQTIVQDAEVVVRQFDTSKSLGENREAMRLAATAEYICFLDDDDLVASDYVASIMQALESNPDYVGFKVQMYVKHKLGPTAIHSLKCGGWSDGGQWRHRPNLVLERDISHINPIRRILALQVPMEGGRGEDQRWALAMNRLGIVTSEIFIDRVLYYYLWRKPKNDETDWTKTWRMEMVKQLTPKPLPSSRWNEQLCRNARLRGIPPDVLRRKMALAE